jgi:hypothetical protein
VWRKKLCKILGVDVEKLWVSCSIYEWCVDQNLRVQSGSQWCVLLWIIHKKLMCQILGCKIEVGNWISDDAVWRKSMKIYFFLWWPIFINTWAFDSYRSSNIVKIWFVMEGLLWSKILNNENMFCENSSWENIVILYCRSEIVTEFATFCFWKWDT